MKIDLRNLSVHLLLFICWGFLPLISGCTKQVAPEKDLFQSNYFRDWEATVSAPPPLKTALTKGQVEDIPCSSAAPIPVRVFGREGKKTPLIMAHGLQSHSGWFAQSAAYIAGLGHPVYSMDRRGSGLSRSKRGDLKDFKEMIADINTVCNFITARHQKDTVYVLGHCFGAIPATAYACEYPDNLKGLILTTPAIYTKTSIPFRYKLKIAFSRSGRRNFMVPSPLETAWFTELEDYEAFIKSDNLSLKEATGDFYYQVHKARKYLHKRRDRLTMPIFLGIAGEDPICNNHRNIQFFTKLPSQDKELITYEDARHILEFSSKKERYFKDLTEWLTTHEGI
jgi:alpha-beta hydrolase superfamily lysophospholipase